MTAGFTHPLVALGLAVFTLGVAAAHPSIHTSRASGTAVGSVRPVIGDDIREPAGAVAPVQPVVQAVVQAPVPLTPGRDSACWWDVPDREEELKRLEAVRAAIR